MADIQLFSLDAQSASYVENTEFGMWTFDFFDHATLDRPDFLVAASGKFGTSAKLTKGQLHYPADGVFPRDKFRIEFRLKCEGADWTAVAGSPRVFRFGDTANEQGQDFRVEKQTNDFVVRLVSNESQVVGGTNRSIEARFTPGVGLFPSNTEVPVQVEYDGTRVKVYVSDVLKATSPDSAVVPFYRFAIGADNRGRDGLFYITGFDNTLSGVSSPFTVSDLIVYANLRLTPETSVTTRAVTVNTGATVGSWTPSRLAGTVGQYFGYGNGGADSSASTRDAALDLFAGIGLGLVREGQDFANSAIPTMSGGPSGTITSVDFSLWKAHWDRFHNRGAEGHLNFGYTPAALRTGGAFNTPPDSDAVYADYCSRIVAYNQSQGYQFVAHSFWNEPEISSFFNGTLAKYLSMRLAAAQKLYSTYGVVLGTSDSQWGQAPSGAGVPNGGDLFLQGSIDQNAANNLPCPPVHLHAYSATITEVRQAIRYYTVYCQSKANSVAAGLQSSYLNPVVRVTEWNYSLAYQGKETDTTTWAGQQRRFGRAHTVAFQHAFLATLVEAGNVDMATMYVMGATSNFENAAVLDDRQVPVIERPAFSLMRLMRKHGPRRGLATVAPKDTLQAICSSGGTNGRIMLTYSFYRPWRPSDALSATVAWSNLPSKFTWTQYKIDSSTETLYTAVPSPGSYAKDALAVIATGNQTNLPTTLTSRALSVGAIEILPAGSSQEGLTVGN